MISCLFIKICDLMDLRSCCRWGLTNKHYYNLYKKNKMRWCKNFHSSYKLLAHMQDTEMLHAIINSKKCVNLGSKIIEIIKNPDIVYSFINNYKSAIFAWCVKNKNIDLFRKVLLSTNYRYFDSSLPDEFLLVLAQVDNLEITVKKDRYTAVGNIAIKDETLCFLIKNSIKCSGEILSVFCRDCHFDICHDIVTKHGVICNNCQNYNHL